MRIQNSNEVGEIEDKVCSIPGDASKHTVVLFDHRHDVLAVLPTSSNSARGSCSANCAPVTVAQRIGRDLLVGRHQFDPLH